MEQKPSYYENYKKRLNRYGFDYQTRIQGQRERDFDNYLYKTIYRVDFKYNGELLPGSLERFKQDYSETQSYLLTRRDVEIPNGTILNVISRNDLENQWMIWWKEEIEASGYNKYVVLKTSHLLTWYLDGKSYSQMGYFSGPGTTTIQATIKSASNSGIYLENNNKHMFITPQHDFLVQDAYFEVEQGNIKQGYRVIEFDINSTPGVEYVTVDPVPLREIVLDNQVQDLVSKKDEQTFWLQGGPN